MQFFTRICSLITICLINLTLPTLFAQPGLPLVEAYQEELIVFKEREIALLQNLKALSQRGGGPQEKAALMEELKYNKNHQHILINAIEETKKEHEQRLKRQLREIEHQLDKEQKKLKRAQKIQELKTDLQRISQLLAELQEKRAVEQEGQVGREPTQPISQPTASDHLSFDDWYTRVRSLTPNICLKDEELSESIIPAEALQRLVLLYSAIVKEQLQRSTWIGTPLPADFFVGMSMHEAEQGNRLHNYKPFVEKMVVQPGAQIAIHGDLHGDIFSLMKFLYDLKQKGYIDNEFRIAKDNAYLLFLGDYTDRGKYGVECIYTILRLKVANPSKVILVRGNHEDFDLTSRYGFAEEIIRKYADPKALDLFFDNWSQYSSKSTFAGKYSLFLKQHRSLASRDEIILVRLIHRIYDLMPVALYLGVPSTDGTINVMQCCHGGMEHGYVPEQLLANQTPHAYEFLPSLLKPSDKLLQDHRFLTLPGEFFSYRSFDQHYSDIGFMWNDFHVDPMLPTTYNPNRGWSFGKDITAALLEKQSTPQAKIRGVLRAHQHGSMDVPMMQSIYDVHNQTPAHKGISKLWKQRGESKFNTNQVWDNMVITFGVGPDNAIFNPLLPSGRHTLSTHTFGILTTAPRYEDWRLDVITFKFPEDILPQATCKH